MDFIFLNGPVWWYSCIYTHIKGILDPILWNSKIWILAVIYYPKHPGICTCLFKGFTLQIWILRLNGCVVRREKGMCPTIIQQSKSKEKWIEKNKIAILNLAAITSILSIIDYSMHITIHIILYSYYFYALYLIHAKIYYLSIHFYFM